MSNPILKSVGWNFAKMQDLIATNQCGLRGWIGRWQSLSVLQKQASRWRFFFHLDQAAVNASRDQHRERLRGHNKWAHWYRHTVNGFALDYTPGLTYRKLDGQVLTYNPGICSTCQICTVQSATIRVGPRKRHWQTAIIALHGGQRSSFRHLL